MKKHPFFFLLLALAFASCEEVIQLELEPGEQRIIVEANLDATHGVCSVSLSKSGDFYESNVFEKIPGVSVVLKSPSGEITLTDLGDGNYKVEQIQLAPGQAVSLQMVFPDGLEVVSDAVVAPQPVALDTLSVASSGSGNGPGNPSGGGVEQFILTAKWSDPAGEENYYRLRIFENNVFQSGTYILTDDRLGDGLEIARPVIRQTFQQGDSLRVQLLAVSKGYYDYFTDLANSEGRGFSAPSPYNPKGNFSGEVLGYFGVWFVSEGGLKI